MNFVNILIFIYNLIKKNTFIHHLNLRSSYIQYCPEYDIIGLGIYKLDPLQKGKIFPKKGCSRYNTKLYLQWGSISGFWGMQCTPSLPLFSGLLWLRVVVPVRVPPISQIELFNHLQRIIIIRYLKQYNCVQIVCIRSEYLILLLMLISNTWNHLTICK